MSITGDSQNVNINGNLVIPSSGNKIRTPLIQFFDNTTLNTANGIWSSNVSGGLLYNGNVTANYYMGNASTLTSLTGASAGSYGSVSNVPQITVDSTGRITSLSNVAINTVATGSTGQIAFYSGSNVVSGNIGLTYTAGTQALSVGGSLTVGGDLIVSGNTYTGNNVVFNDAIVEIGNAYPNGTTLGLLMQRPAGNVMMGYLSTEGGFSNTLAFGYTFGSAEGPLLTPDTSNVLPVRIFGNLTTTSNLYVGSVDNFVVDAANKHVGIGNSSPTHNLDVGSNLYIHDTGSNVLVTSGNISANYLFGNGANLTGIPVSNLQSVVASGNATVGTVLFQNTGVSLVTSGSVGVANTAPTHTLDVGSNTFVSDTGANTIVTLGNVSANYFVGSGSRLTGLTGASAGSYGNAYSVPQISVDSNGRVSSITNVAIQTTLDQAVSFGNTTSNIITTGGLTTSGNVSATNFFGSAANLTGLTGASAGTYGPAQIVVDSNGRITSLSNVASAAETLSDVVNRGNTTSNTVQFTNSVNSVVTSGNVSIGNQLLVSGTSNLVGNTVASNISVFSISFGGTSNGYVRTISLQDTTDISNVTTALITAGGLSLTNTNPVFPTSLTAYGTWGATPTPALGGASLGAFTATIGANITNFTPSGGLTNGKYRIYAVSNGSWTIAANVAGSVSNLSTSLSVTTGNRVLIEITYDGTVYYVNYVKYS